MRIQRLSSSRIQAKRAALVAVLLAAALGPGARGDVEGLDLFFSDGFETGGVCGWSSGGGIPDACPYNFLCAGDVPPTTAPDPIALSGTLTDLPSGSAISGATVEGRLRSNDVLLDTDTTAANGSFALSAATGGVPVSAYLVATAAGYPATYLYPPDALASDVANLPARSVTTTNVNLIYLFSVGAQTPGTGTSAAMVVDCTGTPIEGATVSFTPAPGAFRYLVGGLPSPSANSTDASGLAVGLNASPAEPLVQALYNGIPLESHTFEVFSGGLSFTVIHP